MAGLITISHADTVVKLYSPSSAVCTRAQWLRDAESMPASEMFCILSFHTVDLTDGPPASIFDIFMDRTC